MLRWQDAPGPAVDDTHEHVLLDMFSGRVVAAQPGGELTSDLAGRLAVALDGELLDALWWAEVKAAGHDADAVTSCVGASGWRRGTLAAWSDAASHARMDIYAVDARSILPEEMFCPMPRCNCREAAVMFTRWVDDGTMGALDAAVSAGVEPELLGVVNVPFDRDGFGFDAPAGARREELRAAWGEYLRRWPRYRRRLFDRYERLREAAAEDLRDDGGSTSAGAGRAGEGRGGNVGPGFVGPEGRRSST